MTITISVLGMTAPEPFEARDICIVHESLWNALVAWADARGMDLVQIPTELLEQASNYDPDSLPSYAFIVRDLPKIGIQL